MRIAIALYNGFYALDAAGPYNVLCYLPGAQVTFVAQRPGPVLDDVKAMSLLATASFDDLPDPDVIVVPGSPNIERSITDEPLVTWIRQAHEHTTWTTSVCTGAFLLGAAGLLNGLHATTHWSRHERLTELGATPVNRRFVVDGKVITSAGVSAGIDMALHLASLLADEQTAQAIQLGLEYDPQPPFNAGSPTSAPPQIVELVRALLAPQP